MTSASLFIPGPVTEMLTFIFLAILLPHAAIPALPLTGPKQVALKEELNVLLYGVLQFSTSLHDLYDSTVQKLDSIRHSIGIHEQGLEMLQHQTQRAQEAQKDIRGVLEELKAEDTVLWHQARNNKKGLQKLLLGHHNVEQRVKRLEERLVSTEKRGFHKKWEPAALKADIQQQQNLTIWSLLGATQQQQQQMGQQMEQLLWIQKETR